MRTVLKNLSYIATFDDQDVELGDADIAIDGPRIDRIGRDLPTHNADRVIDGSGLLATPGLVNAHQHLYQASLRTIPRLERSGMPAFLAVQNTVALDRWRAGQLGAREQRAIARAALTESVLGGITTVADQHLFFPGEQPEPHVEQTIAAAGEVGVRLHACRGTITFSRAQGGRVSDEQAEPIEDIVGHCRELIAEFHDPEPFAMVRVALAPSGVISDIPPLGACLGRDDLGVLAPGKAADIACWDLTGVDRIGINDPVAALLFTGLSQTARLVFVNGQIVVEGGLPARLDPAEVARQARDRIPAGAVR